MTFEMASPTKVACQGCQEGGAVAKLEAGE